MPLSLLRATTLRSTTLRAHLTALLATVLLAATLLAATPTSAQANDVGGLGFDDYYIEAQVSAKTTCVGSASRVYTVVDATPDSNTGGQWIHAKVWARDASGVGGPWKLMATPQKWIPFVGSAINSSQPQRLADVSFTGTKGRYYQVFVESYAYRSDYGWERLYDNSGWGGTAWHYQTFGTGSASVYGAAIQAMSGAAGSYCRIL